MTATASSEDPEIIQLDSRFSTTRLVTRKQPLLNDPSLSKVPSFSFLPSHPDRKGEGGLRTKGYFKRAYKNDSAEPEVSNFTLVSIVTVVFNGEKYLERTIQSVLGQTYRNVEYIIIDGGSTDRTIDIIREYEDKIDYWISEPDEGISDAMNKGAILASGTLINHLHAGDLFENETVVSQVVSSYQEEKWHWCYGNREFIDPSGKTLYHLYPPEFSETLLHLTNFIPHETVFSEKSLLIDAGLFDKRFKIAMDYHLWLRYAKVSYPKKIDKTLTRFLVGGTSSDSLSAFIDDLRAKRDILQQSEWEKFVDIFLGSIKYVKRRLNITSIGSKELEMMLKAKNKMIVSIKKLL